MGYRVKCYPKDSAAGYLERGKIVKPYQDGTYYPHPSAARISANRWLAKNPGCRAEVLTYSDESLIEELRS